MYKPINRMKLILHKYFIDTLTGMCMDGVYDSDS